MVAAAQVLRVAVFHALLGEPADDLGVADHRCVCALGNRHGIAHVIAVAVRDQNVIGLHFIGGGRSGGIAAEKRID